MGLNPVMAASHIASVGGFALPFRRRGVAVKNKPYSDSGQPISRRGGRRVADQDSTCRATYGPLFTHEERPSTLRRRTVSTVGCEAGGVL